MSFSVVLRRKSERKLASLLSDLSVVVIGRGKGSYFGPAIPPTTEAEAHRVKVYCARLTVADTFSAKFRALLLTLICLSGCLWPESAGAHAEFVGADPAPSSALALAPDTLRLTFSEKVEARLSSVTMLSADGTPVRLGEADADLGDPKTLVVPVPGAAARETGLYTVVWSVFSAEDNHTTSGSYTFSVGTGVAPVEDLESDERVATAAILGKWLELIGVVLLTGLSFFAATTRRDFGVPGRSSLNALAVLAAMALSGALISLRAKEAAITGNELIGPIDSGAVTDLLSSTYGRAWVARVVVLLGVVALVAWGRARNAVGRLMLVAGMGFFSMLSVAVAGHAAAVDDPWFATFADLIHMTGAAVWVGGLLGLLMVSESRCTSERYLQLLRSQGNRFVIAIGVIVATGLASAWWQIGGRRQLTRSDYGQTLLIKIGMVCAILLVAFYSRRVLQHAGGRLEWVPFAIGLELVLALMVLLFSADLSQTSPANGALPTDIAARAIELDSRESVDGLSIDLSGVLTGDPADWISVDVSPADNVQRVIVQTNLVDASTGLRIGDRFDAEPVSGGAGTFRFPAGRLGVAGAWNVEVTVRRAGLEDESVTVGIDTTSLAARSTERVADSWLGFRATSHTALALGLAVGMLLIGLGGLRRITGLEPMASGFLIGASFLIAGGFLVSAARSVIPVTADHRVSSPITLDSAVVTRAADLYRVNCAACHGIDGTGVRNGGVSHLHGDGADLTRSQTVRQTDGDLRYWIGNGVPGTDMPAFSQALTDDEIWSLVLHLRELQEAAEATAEARET
jgi:putative copper export protein/methionine-rich copper-binding protein CopC/mono/diheme cytochrome c family protein